MGKLDSLRLVDPVLSKIAFGYTLNPKGFVAERLLPSLGVDKEAGKYPIFGKESFKVYNTYRALSAETPLVDMSATTGSYTLDEHSLEAAIDDREVQESNWPIGVEQAKLQMITNNLLIEKEKLVADEVQDDGNYDATNKKVLDGTAGKYYWSDTTNGTPIKDIQAAMNAIRSDIGHYPNKILFGAKAWENLTNHPNVIDKLKYSQLAVVTVELVKKILGDDKGVDLEIIIGGGIYDNSGSFADIWEDNCILAYSQNGLFVPSFGTMLNKNGYPKVTKYRNESRKSNIVSNSLLYAPLYQCWDAAYLIKTTQEPS